MPGAAPGLEHAQTGPGAGAHRRPRQTTSGVVDGCAGTRQRQGPAASAAVPDAGPEAPTGAGAEAKRDNELQDNVRDQERDLDYRGTRIKTLQELLVYAEVDTSVWEVERHVLNKYEVAAKTPEGMATSMLFQIKVWLRRKVVEQNLQGVLERLLARFREPVVLPAVPRFETAGRRGLLELSLMDLHFGKYCSRMETGARDYDADTAAKMFTVALQDLLQKAGRLQFERVLFVIGNDYFNTDNLGRTTTAGTPQDECLRYQESFARGKELMVSGINLLRQVAPVDILMVTGNHDTQRLYYLGHALEGIFLNTPHVKVDNSSRQRKYVRYHQNLIGFTHGNNEKHFDLPLLLATEAQEDWAKSRHREFHLGHFHSRKHKMFVPSYDRAGVLVRILPSLCPPDAWHASMGYSARLAAEALYFDPEDGCVATFTHSPN